MRWNTKKPGAWQLVFAWMPVQTESGVTAWLERVWRTSDDWGGYIYEVREAEPNQPRERECPFPVRKTRDHQ